MALYSAVGSLVLIDAGGADQDRGHHGKGSEAGRHHIAHDVAVIVFERPQESALGPHDTGNCIVDQRVEKFKAFCIKFFFVFILIDLLEDFLEIAVVDLGDGILGGEPEIHFLVQRIGKAGTCEALDRLIQIVETLDDTGALELMDDLACLIALCIPEDKLCCAGTGYPVLYVFVDIAVGVTGHNDRLFPGADIGVDPVYEDGSTENCPVQSCADRAVGALVHGLQVILFYARRIGGDRRTLDGYTVFLRGLGRVNCDLIIGLIPFGKSEVIILCLQINIGKKEIVFDHLPDDAGHLISVHLHKRCLHHNFVHFCSLLRVIPGGWSAQYSRHLPDISKCHNTISVIALLPDKSHTGRF